MTKTFCDNCKKETDHMATSPREGRIWLTNGSGGNWLTFKAQVISAQQQEHLCDKCWTESLHGAFPAPTTQEPSPTNNDQP